MKKKIAILVMLLFYLTSCQPTEMPKFDEQMFSNDISFSIDHLNQKEYWNKIDSIGSYQDSDCFRNVLASYASTGGLCLYNIRDKNNLVLNIPIKEGTIPHCNTVSFSDIFYDEKNDFFPIIYVNAYTKLPIGTFYGIRINYNNNTVTQEIVQTITIGFVDDITYWPNHNEIRPYGNFIINREDKSFFAYVPDERIKKTRIYECKMPSIENSNVIIQKKDILNYFEIPIIRFPQGGYYLNQKLISISGFGSNTEHPGMLTIIDTEKELIENELRLDDFLFKDEPESVFSYNNKLYISSLYETFYI